jgi:hypothetical protein
VALEVERICSDRIQKTQGLQSFKRTLCVAALLFYGEKLPASDARRKLAIHRMNPSPRVAQNLSPSVYSPTRTLRFVTVSFWHPSAAPVVQPLAATAEHHDLTLVIQF